MFINSVYLFDDKIVIYYNIRDGKQVSYIEMLEDVGDAPSPDADLPEADVFDFQRDCSTMSTENRTRYIFAGGLFGIVIFRDDQ